MAKELNCKQVAQEIKDSVKKEIAENNLDLTLAVVLVGNDQASEVYVRNKEKVSAEVGIHSEVHRLPEDTTQDVLNALIKELNDSEKVTAILLQLPLPQHLDSQQAIELISPNKDVDGLTLHNQGLLAVGNEEDAIIPCTPLGIVHLMDAIGYNVSGKHVTVLGRSNLLGKPMARLMMNRNATVSVCHSKTKRVDRDALMQMSQVVISGIGQAKKIKFTYYFPTELIIDAGINRDKDGKLVGDIDTKTLPKTSQYTPVPGGVGLLTTATLVENVIKCHKLQTK